MVGPSPAPSLTYEAGGVVCKGDPPRPGGPSGRWCSSARCSLLGRDLTTLFGLGTMANRLLSRTPMADILLVDDDAALRSVLRKVLELRGHDVREADDGARVMGMIERDLPDLLVIDLYMPEKEGIETIVEVREAYPGLPILAVSGGGTMGPGGPLGDAEALGADASLAKPFSIEDFSNTVRRLLPPTDS